MDKDTKAAPRRCFACDKALRGKAWLVDTRDDQRVYVGPDCYRKVKRAGENGYRYPGIGPRLYLCAEGKP